MPSAGTTPMSPRATPPLTRSRGSSSPASGSHLFSTEARTRPHLHGHRPRRQHRLGHDQQRQHRQDGADDDRHARARGQCQRLEQHRCHRDLRRRPMRSRASTPARPATVLSTEGAGQSAAGSGTDKAGNSASATVSGINIDKTAPTIIGQPRRRRQRHRLEQHRRHRELHAPVTHCSGLESAPATGSFTFTGEGAGQSHTFTVHRPRRQHRLGHDQRRQHRQDGADDERQRRTPRRMPTAGITPM